MDRRGRGDKSPLLLRRNLQRSQPAVYQLHLVLDLRFSNLLLSGILFCLIALLCEVDIRIDTHVVSWQSMPYYPFLER
jgi:hypothetical protein